MVFFIQLPSFTGCISRSTFESVEWIQCTYWPEKKKNSNCFDTETGPFYPCWDIAHDLTSSHQKTIHDVAFRIESRSSNERYKRRTLFRNFSAMSADSYLLFEPLEPEHIFVVRGTRSQLDVDVKLLLLLLRQMYIIRICNSLYSSYATHHCPRA
jgi:hypothetical protein